MILMLLNDNNLIYDVANSDARAPSDYKRETFEV